jgi:hypothetical protein
VSGRLDGWCSAYGGERKGGAQVFGGFLDNPITTMNICRERADHRFRWRCECGHLGEIVPLCRNHYLEFSGSREAPWNVRRDVRACPRCASMAETPEQQHKCKVRLETVS